MYRNLSRLATAGLTAVALVTLRKPHCWSVSSAAPFRFDMKPGGWPTKISMSAIFGNYRRPILVTTNAPCEGRRRTGRMVVRRVGDLQRCSQK